MGNIKMTEKKEFEGHWYNALLWPLVNF